MNKKNEYFELPASKLSVVDSDEVVETQDTVRWNNDNTKFICKTKVGIVASGVMNPHTAVEDVYALLAAALGTTDVTNAYKGIGIHLADAGWTNKELATALLATDTYKTDAGGVSNETFIKHVYKNVFGTDATLTQVTDYTAWMTNSNLSQADVLVAASELAAFETTIGLVGLATTGIEYTPVVA